MIYGSVSTLEGLYERLVSTQRVVVDVETSGREPFHGDYTCGIGLGAVDGSWNSFIPIRTPDSEGLGEEVARRISTLISDVPEVVGHNIKFDLHFLARHGYFPAKTQVLRDTIVLGRLIEKDRFPGLGLKALSERHLGEESVLYDQKFSEVKKLLKIKVSDEGFAAAPAVSLAPYCLGDVSCTGRLITLFEPEIKATMGELWETECLLTKVLFGMEERGLPIDQEYCWEAIKVCERRKLVLEKEIKEVLGDINIGSAKQVGAAFGVLGIKSPHKTPKGNPSWSEVSLLMLEHPVALKIREWRTWEHLINTYFEPLGIFPETHGSFRNWGTITGRLSSANPNLQNIPRFVQSEAGFNVNTEGLARARQMVLARGASKTGKIIGGSTLASWLPKIAYTDEMEGVVSVRRAFVPRPGFKMYCVDYKQMEIVVFVTYLGDKELLRKIMEEGLDFHGETARRIWGVTPGDPKWDFYRIMAKGITFGLIYGMGDEALAYQINATLVEAQKFRLEYFKHYPTVPKFLYGIRDRIEERGYLTNAFGRRYYLDLHESYVGVNYLVQGSSADFVKIKMVGWGAALPNIGLLLQVHDELVFEVPEGLDQMTAVEGVRAYLQAPIRGIKIATEIKVCLPSWAQKASLPWEKKE